MNAQKERKQIGNEFATIEETNNPTHPIKLTWDDGEKYEFKDREDLQKTITLIEITGR